MARCGPPSRLMVKSGGEVAQLVLLVSNTASTLPAGSMAARQPSSGPTKTTYLPAGGQGRAGGEACVFACRGARQGRAGQGRKSNGLGVKGGGGMEHGAHTHTHTHARTHGHTRTHTRTHGHARTHTHTRTCSVAGSNTQHGAHLLSATLQGRCSQTPPCAAASTAMLPCLPPQHPRTQTAAATRTAHG